MESQSLRENADVLISNALKSGQAINPKLQAVQYLLFDPDNNRRLIVVLNTSINRIPAESLTVNMDVRTGLALAPPEPEGGFM